MDKSLKNMRAESKSLPPNIIIGKNGITDHVIANIKTELSRQKLIKIRILQSYIGDKDKEDVFKEISEKAGAKAVHKIGFTISLTKR